MRAPSLSFSNDRERLESQVDEILIDGIHFRNICARRSWEKRWPCGLDRDDYNGVKVGRENQKPNYSNRA
jgi:hypothetical protein